MYKVLLVDNEQTIRRGIRGCLNWTKLGLEVVGEAEDGQIALNMINELQPDILITDIKMPHVDGLQLSEMAMNTYPDLKVILISGFDDFKYAQKGISLGVSGYLLKPLQQRDLEELLIKLMEELKKNAVVRKSETTLASINTEQLVLEKFLRGVIVGKRDEAETSSMQRLLMSENLNSFATMVLEVDGYLNTIRDMSEEEQQSFSRIFFETTDNYFAGIRGVVNVPADNCTCIVALYDTEESRLSSNVMRICTQLKQIMQNCDMSVSIGVGGTYTSAQGWRESYKEARLALKHKFVMGENSTIYYASIESMENTYDFSQIKMVSNVIEAVRKNDQKLLRSVLDNAAVEMMTGGKMTDAYMNLFISGVFRQTLSYLESLDISADEIFENPMEVYADMINRQTVKAMIDRVYHQLCRVINYVSLKKQGKFSAYIDLAKRYIEEHFTESDINLDQIAGQIQMSVSYFSMEFKKHLGQTYIEFLTDLRIRRAKELLQGTSLKISEISDMVGYENPSYFNYIFKKNTGKTPGEFRKN